MVFSVYIALYNTEKYIAEAIDSVINQTFRDFELLIIDDGSTDRSLNIARSFAERDDRIRIITQENQGLFHARITAFRNVRGKYIVALDADDRLKVNALEIIAAALMQEPPVDICEYCLERTNFITKGFPVLKKSQDLLTVEEMESYYRKTLFSNAHNSQCVKALRREISQDVSQIEKLPRISIGEDIIHTLHYLPRVKSIRVINEVLYQYRNNIDGLCNRFNPNIIDDMQQVYWAKIRFLRMYPLYISDGSIEDDFAKSVIKALLYNPSIVAGVEGKATYISVVEKTIEDEKIMRLMGSAKVGLAYLVPIYLLKLRLKYVFYYLKRVCWCLRRFMDRMNLNGLINKVTP